MSIVLQGSTSGSITLQEPAIAGSTVLSLPATSGTLITTGSTGQVIPRAALPTGSVLQVVSTTLTSQQTYTAAAMTDVSGLSATITPTSSSSKILVIVNLSYSASGNRDAAFQTVRGSTVIPAGVTGSLLNGASSGAFINAMLSFAQSYLDSPATTSPTTYKVQVAINADTLFVNRRALDGNFTGQSTITLMEIAA